MQAVLPNESAPPLFDVSLFRGYTVRDKKSFSATKMIRIARERPFGGPEWTAEKTVHFWLQEGGIGFVAGDLVRLHGLKKTDMNGLSGTIMGQETVKNRMDGGRYKVRLGSDSSFKLIQAHNLRIVLASGASS